MKFPEQFRWKDAPKPYATSAGEPFGLFIIKAASANGRILKVMACCATPESNGWEHASVSLLDYPKKTPSWEELCVVKDLFWDANECVVQFHPRKIDAVNIAQVLHLWRDTKNPFGMPPPHCV